MSSMRWVTVLLSRSLRTYIYFFAESSNLVMSTNASYKQMAGISKLDSSLGCSEEDMY